jgi:A/G-specific adenine glycosylase
VLKEKGHLEERRLRRKSGTVKKRATRKPNSIPDLVLQWYAEHQRDLPWRRTRNPYFIWVSEIMLQQTQVDTVLPYYERFLSAFPTVPSLAAASLQEVLKVWENMGYYSRARHLHAAAQEIMTRWAGRIPDSEKDLLSLPGIGRYTAAAILSFAFGHRVAPVDGNVRRIICRLFAIREPLDQAHTLRRIHQWAEELVPEGRSSPFNQGLMDLGATVCTPRNPSCTLCPLETPCLARKQGLEKRLPISKKRAPLEHKDVTAALFSDKRGRLLIVQRPASGLLGGLWKFPGDTAKPGESLEGALKRTVREELGIEAEVQEALTAVKHAYTHFRVTVHAYQCRFNGAKPRALGCQAWQWSPPSNLPRYPFSKADRKIMEATGIHRPFDPAGAL